MKFRLTLDEIQDFIVEKCDGEEVFDHYFRKLKKHVEGYVIEGDLKKTDPLRRTTLVKTSEILEATNLEFSFWCLRCLPEKYWKEIYDLAMDYYNLVKPKFLEMNPLADCEGKIKEAEELVKDCKGASNLIVAFSQNAIKAKAYLETGVHDFMPFVPDDYIELKYKNDQIIIAETKIHEEMLVNQFG